MGAAATISLPIVIAGGLVATAAVSFGVYNLTGFKERGALRLEEQILKATQMTVLGQDTQSALSIYRAELDRVVEMVLQGANNGTNLPV